MTAANLKSVLETVIKEAMVGSNHGFELSTVESG
jgi:hypothetical protein